MAVEDRTMRPQESSHPDIREATEIRSGRVPVYYFVEQKVKRVHPIDAQLAIQPRTQNGTIFPPAGTIAPVDMISEDESQRLSVPASNIPAYLGKGFRIATDQDGPSVAIAVDDTPTSNISEDDQGDAGNQSPTPEEIRASLEQQTVVELKEAAQLAGIVGAGNMNKATLVDNLVEHHTQADNE